MKVLVTQKNNLLKMNQMSKKPSMKMIIIMRRTKMLKVMSILNKNQISDVHLRKFGNIKRRKVKAKFMMIPS